MGVGKDNVYRMWHLTEFMGGPEPMVRLHRGDLGVDEEFLLTVYEDRQLWTAANTQSPTVFYNLLGQFAPGFVAITSPATRDTLRRIYMATGHI